MTWMARFMRFVSRSGILSDARLLEMYPPFVPMRIRVLEITEGWRHVRILLPLNARSRNPGGVMFGGYQAALADPVAALACARVFRVTPCGRAPCRFRLIMAEIPTWR